MKRFMADEGWRKFAFEIAVVVIGVLLALGAQQVADAINTRAQVREFRATVDAEVAYDLGAYQERLEQSRCLKRRLIELEAWLDGWRAGKPKPLAAPIGSPEGLALRTSAWETRTDAIVAHMPLADRIAFARIYTEFALFANLRTREGEPWEQLQAFDGATDLDRRDLMRLRGLITSTRRLNGFMESNWQGLSAIARSVGIVPYRDPNDATAAPMMCKPLHGVAADG